VGLWGTLWKYWPVLIIIFGLGFAAAAYQCLDNESVSTGIIIRVSGNCAVAILTWFAGRDKSSG